jgi:hypothetical protein
MLNNTITESVNVELPTCKQETYVRKQNEVLEAGVKMSFLLEADNLLKM